MNVIDVYEKRDRNTWNKDERVLRFLHTSTGTDQTLFMRTGNLYGVIVDENLNTQHCSFNPRKMISKGWRKVTNPILSLQEQMLADITQLVEFKDDGGEIVSVDRVIGMINNYAKLMQVEGSLCMYKS